MRASFFTHFTCTTRPVSSTFSPDFLAPLFFEVSTGSRSELYFYFDSSVYFDSFVVHPPIENG
jgi:hypothetical protein